MTWKNNLSRLLVGAFFFPGKQTILWNESRLDGFPKFGLKQEGATWRPEAESWLKEHEDCRTSKWGSRLGRSLPRILSEWGITSGKLEAKLTQLENERESFILINCSLERIGAIKHGSILSDLCSAITQCQTIAPTWPWCCGQYSGSLSPTEKSGCSEYWFLQRKRLTPKANLVWVKVLLLSTGANCNHRLLPFPKH